MRDVMFVFMARVQLVFEQRLPKLLLDQYDVSLPLLARALSL
jgi:hypothetical protein